MKLYATWHSYFVFNKCQHYIENFIMSEENLLRRFKEFALTSNEIVKCITDSICRKLTLNLIKMKFCIIK